MALAVAAQQSGMLLPEHAKARRAMLRTSVTLSARTLGSLASNHGSRWVWRLRRQRLDEIWQRTRGKPA